MTSTPPRAHAPWARRPGRRLAQLLLGSAVLGSGVALTLLAGLGADAVGVMVGGFGVALGVSYGVANAVLSVVVVLALLALGRRPGVSTVVSPLVVGATVDSVLALLTSPGTLVEQVALLVAGVLLIGAGAALYLGANWGAGPFDGVPLEISERTGLGTTVGYVIFLVVAFGTGALLGGPIGFGSVVATFAVGPVVGFLLPRVMVRADVVENDESGGVSGGRD